MRMFTEVGRRVHLHNTGAGKALLAQLDDDTIAKLIQRIGLPAATEHSITDPDVLTRELAKVRRQGYAIDDGEQDVGVRCVAVPVVGGSSLFAISVSGPSARMNSELVERAVPILKSAAEDLGEGLTAERSSA